MSYANDDKLHACFQLQQAKSGNDIKEKENVVNETTNNEEENAKAEEPAVSNEHELMDTDDEDDSKPTATLMNCPTTKGEPKSKKRVIEDSDSEDDALIQPLKQSPKKMDVDDGDYSDDGTVSIDEEPENEAEEESPKKKSKKQKAISEAIEKKINVGNKSANTAKGMKSNAQLSTYLVQQMLSDDAWKEKKPLPYSALCDVFSSIEAISSRLEIQEKLTELFRIVLLRDGGGDEIKSEKYDKKADVLKSDLYSLIYLASNTVAPSYECVELGVGDSILIKAIGEASGTAPNMIKKKYEAEGDLGTVAQTSKGKQKTLVGFGRMAGPKRLEAREVLKVFREIATTSGSQSQKWKVDKIKGLLVRARGSEPKYIIRGLQGKLRIGLAQSTVLVALAHAVTLTRPKDVMPLTEERSKEIRAMDDGDQGRLTST